MHGIRDARLAFLFAEIPAHFTAVRADAVRGRLPRRWQLLESLAIVAELECRVDGAETDSVLARAFDAARVAETTSGEYEAAIKWMEADLVASDAMALLISRLPAQSAR